MTAAGDRPLLGRVVLVTRPLGAEGLARRLSELGARAVARPTIALVPPADLGPCRQAIAAVESYDWLLFTSSHGVSFFVEMLVQSGGDPRALASRIAAIGPGTARELRRAGLGVDLVASDSRSEGLLAALRPQLLPGQRVLLVRPEVARPILAVALRNAGVEIDDIAFYRNEASPEAAAVAGEILEGRFDAAVFTSPSTLLRLLEAAGENRAALLDALRRTRLVAIGPVTARALEASSLQAAAVASSPSEDGIVEAICSLFRR